jgi:RNA recognition motif-containing protein
MQPSQSNPNKVYVGNLPYSVDDAQMREMCAEFGEIKDVKVISDYATGRSKGFAFVEFTSEDAANKCVEGLNGREMDGRALNVTIARPQAPRGDRPSFGGGGGRPSFNRDRRGGGGGGGGGGRRF